MEQNNTKQLIIKKALELFAENGYDSVSVAQIAKAVGIKAPSLYSHFKNKQAIFDAVFEDTALQYETFADGIDIHMHSAEKDTGLFSQVTEANLIQKVREIFKYSLHNEEISRFRRMMTIEQFRSEKLSALYSERYVDRLIKYHTEIFKSMTDLGIIVDENPKALALMYVAPIITLLGICDRQPEREAECLAMLDEHVKLFYRTKRKK